MRRMLPSGRAAYHPAAPKRRRTQTRRLESRISPSPSNAPLGPVCSVSDEGVPEGKHEVEQEARPVGAREEAGREREAGAHLHLLSRASAAGAAPRASARRNARME